MSDMLFPISLLLGDSWFVQQWSARMPVRLSLREDKDSVIVFTLLANGTTNNDAPSAAKEALSASAACAS
jgi:hypothetical protein